MIIKYYGENGELAIYENVTNITVVNSDHESEYQSKISVSPFNDPNLTESEQTIIFNDMSHDGRQIALHVIDVAFICNDRGETVEVVKAPPHLPLTQNI